MNAGQAGQANTGPSKLLVGLIGAGIQRSLTPAMHEEEARCQGLQLHYQLIDLDAAGVGADKLPTLVEAARIMGFAGLNITYPCKQTVIPRLDDLSDEARAMGAVNTVVFRDGRAIGHNTDGSGWAWGLRRTLPQADLSRVVLLHATPTGMDRLPGLPLPAELLRPELWVAEVVYFPLDTALLQAARARGCATVHGGTMAMGQAIGAFERFTGRAADAARVEAHVRQLLVERHAA